jgi:hypothetical protein
VNPALWSAGILAVAALWGHGKRNTGAASSPGAGAANTVTGAPLANRPCGCGCGPAGGATVNAVAESPAIANSVTGAASITAAPAIVPNDGLFGSMSQAGVVT